MDLNNVMWEVSPFDHFKVSIGIGLCPLSCGATHVSGHHPRPVDASLPRELPPGELQTPSKY